ncbi:hypothetical protein GCM10010336_68970 [Streptomyces goshikiensis]|nr:hypothetical protein GCM10010336_68970 [Streptomyces goshikiensis]
MKGTGRGASQKQEKTVLFESSRPPRTAAGLWIMSVVVLTVSLFRRLLDRVLMSLPASPERKGGGLPVRRLLPRSSAGLSGVSPRS